LIFVDWDGKEHPLEGKLPKDDSNAIIQLVEWDRHVALLHRAGQLYEADTGKRTLTVSKRKPVPLIDADGERLAYHVFPGGATAVCLFACEEMRGAEKHEFHRIEVQDLAGLTRRVIVKDCRAVPCLYPSPDRNTLALFYVLRAPVEEVRLLVINSAGKVVSDFKTEK
jgi:hypothetical protein